MKKILLILLGCVCACKQSYSPPPVTAPRSYLVVEGFINSGTDSTFIRLSRTVSLDSGSQSIPELGAKLEVEGADNSSYPLIELGKGSYTAPGLALNPAITYRLSILTTDGRKYESDYVPLKPSPPIDSIGWTLTGTGLQIYVNTHDPQNGSRYYRWTYEQTWQFHSFYDSQYEYVDSVVSIRFPDTIFYCWSYANSTSVVLGSSTKLAQDLIYQAPVVLIPPDSWMISIKYSILVKQYVLTADAYAFWLNLQKNTEQIGSVFSPQPSEVKTNLHCLTDTTDRVVGYISAGSMQQKRVYITPDQIPGWKAIPNPNDCPLRVIPNNRDTLEYYNLQHYLIVNNATIPIGWPPLPDSFNIARAACVDCTLAGSNVKPYFWP